MSAHCSICSHPDAPTINSLRKSGTPILDIARRHNLTGSRGSLYRHFQHGHDSEPKPKPILAPTDILAPKTDKGENQTDADKAKRKAMRHLSTAVKAGDLKAVNGAIQSLVKTIELSSKLKGELQSGQRVDVSVTVEARQAMDVHAAAAALSPHDVTEQARSWLAAQLEAGDTHAQRAVLELMRLIPGADATDAAPAQ